MDTLIDWQLFSNNKLIIDLKNVKSTYKKNEYLEYNEDNTKNVINIKDRIYDRNTNEYKMTIDFNNKICYFKLSNKEEISININCSLDINDNKIDIKYKMDEDKRIVIVIRK